MLVVRAKKRSLSVLVFKPLSQGLTYRQVAEWWCGRENKKEFPAQEIKASDFVKFTAASRYVIERLVTPEGKHSLACDNRPSIPVGRQ